MPAGNGIATFAFARAGFETTAVEPDPSASVGYGAIRNLIDEGAFRATIVKAYGEGLPFASETFDLVYVRQGLHHARDLNRMALEYSRVLRKGGLLLACREHVVDDYGASLDAFLKSQVDHQLYGGENAFTLEDYRLAIVKAGLEIVAELTPYDLPINLHPNSTASLEEKILKSRPGQILNTVLPAHAVVSIGMWRLRKSKMPGRLYSFVAIRN